jgi:hypothetical protein
MALTFACEQLVDVDDLTCECDLPADENVIEEVLDASSDFLSQLAARPLGRCEKAYRPCRDDWCAPVFCNCCNLRGIHLPGIAPTVEAVWVDGAQLATSEYIVMISPNGQHVLERINADGNAISWPLCRNPRRARTLDGTFEIVVESGDAVNQMMRLAAGEIACDMFAFLTGGEHLLPAGLVSAVIYGVTTNTRLPYDTKTGRPKIDLSSFPWVTRFLESLPTTRGTQILSPELDDGWTLFQHA